MRRPLWTVVIVSVATFMVGIDNMVVTNALSEIRNDLGGGAGMLTWTVNAYTLSFAVLLLTGAAFGDRYGRKRLFVVGLTAFTAASAGAALAPGMGVLIAARAVQGVGAAIVMPLTLTLLSEAVTGPRRGAAMGAWGALSGLSVGVGPVIGGAITQYASWQWIFWINVPIGAILLPLAIAGLTESHGGSRAIDLPGVALASTGLTGIVYGLVRGGDVGWTSPQVLGALVAGGLLLTAFLLVEARSATPMLPLRLFRDRGFAVVNAVAFVMSFGVFGVAFLLAQFMQNVQGFSPLGAGVRMLAWTAMPVIAAPVAGMLSNRLAGRWLVSAGLALMAAGLAWIGAVLAVHVGYAVMVPGMVVAGVGMGLFFVPLSRLVLGFAPPGAAGVASGTSNTMRQLGTLMGVAVLGSVFASAGGYATGQSFVDGIRPALAIAVAVLVGAVLLTLLIPSRAVAEPVLEMAA